MVNKPMTTAERIRSKPETLPARSSVLQYGHKKGATARMLVVRTIGDKALLRFRFRPGAGNANGVFLGFFFFFSTRALDPEALRTRPNGSQ